MLTGQFADKPTRGQSGMDHCWLFNLPTFIATRLPHRYCSKNVNGQKPTQTCCWLIQQKLHTVQYRHSSHSFTAIMCSKFSMKYFGMLTSLQKVGSMIFPQAN